MSLRLIEMTDTERRDLPPAGDAGLGTLRTERGNLPLASLDLDVRIAGLIAHTELSQRFHNPHDEPLEATYVFPLPDRAAVTGMRMTADDRVIEAELAERGAARARYDQALAAGRRASIAEQERPDVFTVRVGNILPGEQVTVALSLAGPLAYEDGEATFRFPLVVAPRYIPGAALGDGAVGDGYAPDTDATPDASRITPPVLLPGFPYPVRLGIEVTVDPGGLSLAEARSSLPVEPAGEGRWRVRPGQRADQDFVLRMPYAGGAQALQVTPDADGDEGTFRLTVLPPAEVAPPSPRDVVLVLDRSGSMRGWKMAAARRAAGRIVDTLTGADRFAVLTFDNVVERPDALDHGLVAATDRHRFRAVEHLAAVQARGGTELLGALREALGLLVDTSATEEQGRDRVLVLVTDGQVGNEDQILKEAGTDLARVRVHTVGIDRAVNAGLLGRLAAAGGGRCELVESEQRLDEAMERIHRRIGAPLVTGLTVTADGLEIQPDTLTPARAPDLFTAVPLVLSGRFRGVPAGALVLEGTDREGAAWRTRAVATTVDNPALAPVWARGHLRDLEDRYVTAGRGAAATDLERRIVATSLRFSVLCRFTAYVATDSRGVTDGAPAHRVVQPVEPAAGWDMLGAAPAPVAPAGYEVLAMGTTEAAAAAPAQAARRGWGPLTGRDRGDRPHRGRPRRPAAPDTTPGPDPLAELRAEVERLRSAEDAPEQRRRELLADLASRLDALLRVWPSGGDQAVAGVRELVSELRGDAVLKLSRAQLDDLWRRLRRLLEALLTVAGPGRPARPDPPRASESTPPQDPPATRRRQGFWRQV